MTLLGHLLVTKMLITPFFMPTKNENNAKILTGLQGQATGSLIGFVVQRNNVIRIKPIKGKKRR